MMNSPKQALSTFLGLDFSELKEYAYQSSRYTKPVYSMDENYYCCTKGGQKPAKHVQGYREHEWIEIKDEHINSFGYKIWKS